MTTTSRFHSIPTTLEDSNKQEDLLEQLPVKTNKRQWLAICLGLMHYTSAGILIGYPSIISAQVNTDETTFKLSEDQSSWIVSIAIIPMAPGALFCGFLLNKFQRKPVLIAITLLEIAAWLTFYFSTTVSNILIGRVLNGIACGMGCPILSQILGEVPKPSIRGLSLSMIMLGMTIGLLIIHILGAFFPWNECALITVIFLIVYFCIVLYLPETYVWYLRQGDIIHAEEAFYWYRSQNQLSQMEFAELKRKQNHNYTHKYNLREVLGLCHKKIMLMPLAIAITASLTIHFSGSKSIMMYSISIISKVIPSLDQYTSTIIVDVIRIFMTIAGSYLVNKFPNRNMFIISGIGSAISHFCFAASYSYSISSSPELNYLLSIVNLIALISYTMFSSFGISPLTWVIAGEVFPLRVKAVASGINAFVYFAFFFITIKLTPNLFDWFGIEGGFIFFGACTTLGTLIIHFILPETKNKTLTEIEELFS